MADAPTEQGPAARRSPSPALILAVVGYSVFVAADDLTVVATMLRPIIGDLGLVLPDGLDDAAWIVNVYLIAFVAVMPIAGRISDVVGRRRTFVAAYAVFIVGSIIIPTASTLGPFMVGRVLTAIGGGAMVPVALAVVGDVYPSRSRARALGTLGAIETLGWVWGPLYGAVLVRFLSWEWQFWLNVPLSIAGVLVTWWALRDLDEPRDRPRVDWLGAVLVTATLVALNVALLGSSEIQSITGFDELEGGGHDFRWLYAVAIVAGAAFVLHTRRRADPLIDPALLRGRTVRLALAANFVVGAALVIAMVDVPLFVNAVEGGLERAAVVSGAVLAGLTASMAIGSYLGGRWTERVGPRRPALIGLGCATVAYVAMGATWSPDTSYVLIAGELAVLGFGFGLTVAPTNSAVIDAAPDDRRGGGAGLVMVTRLLGFSVGLSALTAWALARFNALRGDIDLPPLSDPGFSAAVRTASEQLTSDAIAETFLATAVVTALGAVAVLAMRRGRLDHSQEVPPVDDPELTEPIDAEAPAPPAVAAAAAAHSSWLHRHLGAVLGAFALVLLGAIAVIGVLLHRVDETNDELARVKAGSALFASQVTGFQNQLSEVAPQVSAGIDEAIAGLETFGQSTIEFQVPIDQNVHFDTEVVIDRTVSVPIRTTLPIEQSFDTTIKVDGPFGIDIPVDVNVPVDVDVPIDLTLDIPINESVPIDVDIPVKLDVPITVDVSSTQLADLATSLAAGLRSMQEILTGLGGG